VGPEMDALVISKFQFMNTFQKILPQSGKIVLTFMPQRVIF
jgi:hypothetical protein